MQTYTRNARTAKNTINADKYKNKERAKKGNKIKQI